MNDAAHMQRRRRAHLVFQDGDGDFQPLQPEGHLGEFLSRKAGGKEKDVSGCRGVRASAAVRSDAPRTDSQVVAKWLIKLAVEATKWLMYASVRLCLMASSWYGTGRARGQ